MSEDKIVISDEVLEAAAKGLARHRWPTAIGVWESFGQGTKDDFRDQARAAIEAAAPHLRAEALTDAANRWPRPWPIEGHDWLNQQAKNERTNPHRSQA